MPANTLGNEELVIFNNIIKEAQSARKEEHAKNKLLWFRDLRKEPSRVELANETGGKPRFGLGLKELRLQFGELESIRRQLAIRFPQDRALYSSLKKPWDQIDRAYFRVLSSVLNKFYLALRRKIKIQIRGREKLQKRAEAFYHYASYLSLYLSACEVSDPASKNFKKDTGIEAEKHKTLFQEAPSKYFIAELLKKPNELLGQIENFNLNTEGYIDLLHLDSEYSCAMSVVKEMIVFVPEFKDSLLGSCHDMEKRYVAVNSKIASARGSASRNRREEIKERRRSRESVKLSVEEKCISEKHAEVRARIAARKVLRDKGQGTQEVESRLDDLVGKLEENNIAQWSARESLRFENNQLGILGASSDEEEYQDALEQVERDVPEKSDSKRGYHSESGTWHEPVIKDKGTNRVVGNAELEEALREGISSQALRKGRQNLRELRQSMRASYCRSQGVVASKIVTLAAQEKELQALVEKYVSPEVEEASVESFHQTQIDAENVEEESITVSHADEQGGVSDSDSSPDYAVEDALAPELNKKLVSGVVGAKGEVHESQQVENQNNNQSVQFRQSVLLGYAEKRKEEDEAHLNAYAETEYGAEIQQEIVVFHRAWTAYTVTSVLSAVASIALFSYVCATADWVSQTPQHIFMGDPSVMCIAISLAMLSVVLGIVAGVYQSKRQRSQYDLRNPPPGKHTSIRTFARQYGEDKKNAESLLDAQVI